MSELAREPSDQELLGLLIQLTARVARLEKNLDRLAKSTLKSGQHCDRFRELDRRDFAYIFERLLKLEMTVFPGLADDLIRFAEITRARGKKVSKRQPHPKKP